MIDNTLSTNLKPDVSVAKHFLKFLDEDSELFTFVIIEEPKSSSNQTSIKILIGSFKQHQEDLVKANLERYGVFVVVNATDGNGRKKENVKKVRAVFVDLDGAPLEPLLKSVLEPHIIVESSPNRFHAY